MGLGLQKVPTGNLQQNSQVNSLVPVGSWHLKSHMGGSIILGHKKLIKLQIPAAKLPYKVIFTCIWISDASAGTCGCYPSQMEVMVLGWLTPAGIIHWGPHAIP